jgi:hypothetical protein
MAFKNTPPLEERVAAFRAELDIFLDARVAEIKKTCPGVPPEVIRLSLTRGMGCQCDAVQEIKRQDNKQAETAA